MSDNGHPLQSVVKSLCLGVPRRTSRRDFDKGVDEPLWAETAAFLQFRSDFLARHKGGVVVNQLTYKTVATPTDPDSQFVLDAMKVYFRNWWSPANLSREGGFRKPDGLGISPGGRIIEIIEVKPHDRYKEGLDQLNDMIDKIRNGLSGYYDETSLNKGMSGPFNPGYATSVKGSPWKPNIGAAVPLPPDPNGSEIAWVCFNPTQRKSSNGDPLADGVILYEIHNIDKARAKAEKQSIPEEVAKRLAQAHAQRIRAKGPQLVPWATEYARNNTTDMDLLKALEYTLGAAALVAVIAVVIIYAPVAAPVVASEGAVVAEEMVRVFVQMGGPRVAATVVNMTVAEYEAYQTAEALEFEVAKRAVMTR